MIRKDHFAKDNDFGMNYIVYHPENYENLPLLIYLHGAGERANNIEHINRHGLPMLISEGREYPAVVLCPQCPGEFVWCNIVRDVKRLIDKVVEEYNIKKDRICITGSSMGGFGTWSMGITYSNFFSAIGPVSGGGMAWRTSNLRTTPVYAIHGKKDELVLPILSEHVVNATNEYGGNAKLLLLDDYAHNDGINKAYRDTDLIDWLLAQRRTDFTPVPEAISECF